MKKILKFNTDKLFKNITSDCVSFVKDNNFNNGILLVYSRHTTCCLKILEDEILHKADVRFFLDKMAPKWKDPEGDQKNIKYLHDLISLREDVASDEPINGHSHIRSLFFNTSVSIPVIDHELILGKWQSIFAIELDPNRDRELILFYLGL